MPTNDFEKPTNFSGGIATGGGDTGWGRIPQNIQVGVHLSPAAPTKRATLPKGTIVWGYQIVPGDTVPAAGTVDIGYTGSLAAFCDDGVLTAASKAALGSPYRCATDVEVIFTATGMTTGTAAVELDINYPTIRR